MSTKCPQLSSTANKLIHFLTNSATPAHLRQIQSQLIVHFLHSDTTVALHFITAASRLSLLRPSLPRLFLTHQYKPHVFTCNTLLKAFSRTAAADHHVPLLIYTQMLKSSVLPNNYTFPFLLKSISDSRAFHQGQSVHSHLVKLGHLNDIYVLNSLLNIYASCRSMDLTRKVFDEMPQRDVVSWTVLIMGYRDLGKYHDALIAFEMMQYAGFLPNHVTMVNALAACAGSGAIEMGIWIHEFVKRSGWELDVILGTSLLDMYLKCGRVEEGEQVFRTMKEKNLFTWNVLIKGLGHAKRGEEAVRWFDKMEREGLFADEVTLVNVLSACSHSGLVDVGKRIFTSLVNGKYRFSPGMKHYACLVDILARAGLVYEALECINGMKFEPTNSMWGSLLNGCRDCGELELARLIAEKLVELEPENCTYYVVLCNVYGEMGRWDEAARVRSLMKAKGLKKDPGSSSAEPDTSEYGYL